MNKLIYVIVCILLGLVHVTFSLPPTELYCYQTFIMSKSGDKSVDPDPLADTVEKRTRTLTEKALQNYEDQKAVFTKKITTSWEKVNQYLTETVSDTSEVDALNTLENEMKKYFSLYDANVSQYIEYLSRVGTEDSLEQAQVFKTRLEQAQKLVFDFSSKLSVLIKSKKQDSGSVVSKHSSSSKKQDSGSVVSKHSSSSKKQKSGSVVSKRSSSSSKASSKLSNILTMKQAQLEAAKVRVKYAEQEAALKKERALIIEQHKVAEAARMRKQLELDADLDLLNQQKEVAAFDAETHFLEARTISISSDSQEFHSLAIEDPIDRVEKFLNDHDIKPVKQEVPNENQIPGETTDQHIPSAEKVHNISPVSPSAEKVHNISPVPPSAEKVHDISPVSPSADNVQNSHSVAGDLTKFLLRKDLVLSRLYVFNDKPECFGIWKSSFSEVVKEIGVTPSEETDLLIKWLGVDSKKHALSIKACNTSNPTKGLQKIWERLENRYGSPEIIHSAVVKKLNDFPRIGPKDNEKLFHLADILGEIESLKEDPKYDSILSYFDSSVGISPIVSKLPSNIQEKWKTRAYSFKNTHSVAYPRFWVFSSFIHEQAKMRNDPGLMYPQTCTSSEKPQAQSHTRTLISSKKTDIKKESKSESELDAPRCPMHKTKHSIHNCRGFKSLSFEDRRAFLKTNHLCFKCCSSADHNARECRQKIKCDDCGSDRHCTAMHIVKGRSDQSVHGGEEETSRKTISSKCTQVCGNKQQYSGKSCAKMVLVKIFHGSEPENVFKTYAILDEQSNRSLAKPALFSKLNISSEEYEYTLKTCADTVVKSGRRAQGCVIESLDGSTRYQLPALIECPMIPDNRDEIPTPQVAMHHPHLHDIASQIPILDEEADVLLLIGRDLIDAHHVLEQKTGSPGSPFAQRLGLGWVIIGEVCLGKVHQPDSVSVNITHLVSKHRASICQPCPNSIQVKEVPFSKSHDDLFTRTSHDDTLGPSVEDREFLRLMESEFCRHSSGHWIAPLPFKHSRPRLPNNRAQALHRAKILEKSFQKDTVKKQHFVQFMREILDSGHAEIAPPLEEGTECWYLPLFGVYHPKKPNQIRGVFDASARFDGVSLNDVLLTGPDLTNSLLGVLLRFRREPIAMTAESSRSIQKMFYCFLVDEKHRDFLRFFWYLDNNPDNKLVEYRMRVHVFGNSPSPAVASYGLLKTASISGNYGLDVQEFVSKDFYVDDGLTSSPSVESAVDLMSRAQEALKVNGNLRLHKIASNSKEVMCSFPPEDLAKDIGVLDLSKDSLPIQRSLGLSWDLQTDTFTFRVSSDIKPYTPRGVLSTVNSIYDPLGLVAPVVVTGKLLLRELIKEKPSWDFPLPETRRAEWETWRDSLILLEHLQIPRSYFGIPLRELSRRELHIFSDASEKAISASAYCAGFTSTGLQSKSLILGKAKVAPKSGHTIPRLELCAAVLATQVYEIICEQLSSFFEAVYFYTDSKVVLGYIQNQTRRFYTYVSNRVAKIHRVSNPSQWSYVRTEENPSDCATRPSGVQDFLDSTWLCGPSDAQLTKSDMSDTFPLVAPDDDVEIRPQVNTLSTSVKPKASLGSHRFERFSSWTRLISAIEILLHISQTFNGGTACSGWHMCRESKTISNKLKAEHLLIQTVQAEVFREEIFHLSSHFLFFEIFKYS